MTGILHFCARTLSRSISKATKNPLERISLELDPSKARAYHRNSLRTAGNAIYNTCVKKSFVRTQCRSLLLINRNIQTTSVLGNTKDVVVPAFADSVSEGDVKWEKQVGDSVVEDETVCEIETDKTSIAVPSPGKGVIEELYVEDGATVKPGMKLFRIKLGA